MTDDSHRIDWTWLALCPAAILLLGFLVVPAAFGLFNTLTDSSPGANTWHFVGLENYRALFSDNTLGIAFGNALLLTLITVPTEAVGGLVIAGLLRRPFPGRSFVRALLLAPWLVSPLAAGVMWHFLYNTQVGLTGWIAGILGGATPPSPLSNPHLALPSVALVDIWRMTPLAAFLLLPGVLAVPQDEWDQAILMGLTVLTTWLVVVIPRIRLLLLTVLLLLIAQGLTTFDTIFVLTGGGPGSLTTTPALYAYGLAIQGHDWPLGSTASWLLAGLVLAIGAVYIVLARREAT